MAKKTIVAPESKQQKVTEVGEGIQVTRDTMSAAHRRALQKYESKQEFIYPVERIAGHKLFIRNTKFPGADSAYPEVQYALYRFVDKFYPYALGGPLYVDEPKNEQESYRAYEKHKVMLKLGLRHIVVEKDSTYEHLLEQLGEGF